MKFGRTHKTQKSWQKMAGLLAVFAVLLVSLTVMQPRSAKAICETPASSIATLGLWLANSFGLLGDFGGAISDFLIQDVETGQEEVDTRIQELDFNYREGWGNLWNAEWLPAMREELKQISTGAISEMRKKGSLIDADNEADRKADIQDAEFDLLEDGAPSENACQADTIMGGGSVSNSNTPQQSSRPGSCGGQSGANIANRQRFGAYQDPASCPAGQTSRFEKECCDGQVYTHQKTNCGQDVTVNWNCTNDSAGASGGNGEERAGMTYATDISEDISKAIALDAMKRATANEGTPEAVGMTAVVAEQWENLDKYCDPTSNGGTLPCSGSAPPELINKDMELGTAFFWGDRMTIDLNDQNYQELVVDAERTFTDQNPASAIPENILDRPQAVKQFNLTRSTAARKQAVHSVMGGLLGSRASRPESEPLPEVQEIRMQAGVPRENTTDKPSLHETMQALMQDRYTTPEFATMIVKKPAELYKDALDIESGHLMQWNMMYANMERLAVMHASEFAQDLEDSEPDFVAQRGSDEYDGTVVNMVPPDDEPPQECEIVEFEIPENPFGCGSGYAGGVSDSAYAGTFSGSLMVPVPSNYITSDYGPRSCSVCASNYHRGVDFRAAIGDPVVASADGVVTIASNNPNHSFGKYVKIDHGSGIETLYAHLSSIVVSPGQTVSRGQLIGYAGNTSNQNLAPHLHFVVYNNGQKVNPNDYLDRNSVPAPSQGGGSGGGDGYTGDCSFDLSAIGDLDICSWPTGASTGTVSPNLTGFLQGYERLSLTPYYDFKGQSICYGHLITGNENPPIPIPATQAFCDQLYIQDLNRFASYVRNETAHCSNLTQNQFDALFSFAYNLGSFRGSVGTAVDACNFDAALAAAQQYNQAGGQVLQGLVDRRAQEQIIGNLHQIRPAECATGLGEEDADGDHDDHDH